MNASIRRIPITLLALMASGCLTLAATDALALPLISEVYYDAAGTDDGQLFVELYGTPGSSLDGLFLEGVNGANGAAGPTIALSGVFPVDGVFVIADATSEGTTSVLGFDVLANFDFQNGPDSIVLRDDTDVLDAVGYGVFGPGEVFAGEGTPADDPPAGSSLARLFADLDSDDNATDFAALATPTPGSVTLAGVPEPQTAALLAAGLGLLGWSGRRGQRAANA